MTIAEHRPTWEPLRSEIAASWQRVQLAGLAPDASLDRVPILEVDPASKLIVAASPVLDEVTVQLEDTSLCLVLADRESRIVDLRFTDRRVETELERIRAVRGGTYSEDVSGTNSVATPFETRRGLVVNGVEHFLEPLKKFSCYGHPILHPVTRRLQGVLDITGVMPQANPLFVPLVRRAVRDIEQRLLDGSRRAERYLLAAFRAAAKYGSRAVVAFGDDVVLTNPAAVDLLQAADHAMLRGLASDVPTDRGLTRKVELASGRVVKLEAHRVDGTGGTMFYLVPAPGRPETGAPHPRRSPEAAQSGIQPQLTRLRGTRSPVLVSGEPGSGRSHAVRVVAGDDPVVTLDAARVPSMGEGAWAAWLEDVVATHQGVIAVEEIQLLPATLCVRLADLVARSAARFVLTSTPRDGLDPQVASLAACCVSGVELLPLRHRRDELPSLAHALARQLRPDGNLRFTPGALAALAAHHWPGNLRELAMVVRHVTESRSAGDVTPADLPEAYRSAGNGRSLTPWEQAEHDAIVAALRATDGNKLQAAERLGISRSTLYNRIRTLKITI